MSYATGRCMCSGLLRHPFSVEHVTQMVRHVYGERVTFHGEFHYVDGIELDVVHGRREPRNVPIYIGATQMSP